MATNCSVDHPGKPTIWRWGLLALAVLVGMIIRLTFLGEGPQDWDAVDFILSLGAYDLSRFQPHFPGYPLYVLTAKGWASLGIEAQTALRATSAMAGALLPLPLMAIAREARPEPLVCSFAPWMAALIPALLLASVRIESDLVGLFIVLLAFAAAGRERYLVAGFIAGIALGVRMGALPLVVGLYAWVAFERRGKKPLEAVLHLVAGSLAGIFIWWIPQILIVGATYFEEGFLFIKGHFTDWGETAFTDPHFKERLTEIASKVWLGLGGGGDSIVISSVVGLFFGGGVLFYFICARSSSDRWLAFFAVPQALVVIFLQNPHRFRHYYPLILGLALLSAWGWMASGSRLRLGGLLLGAIVLGDSFLLLVERSKTVPPRLQAVREVLLRTRSEDSWVFCGESSRLFEFEDPEKTLVVRRARDLNGVEREIQMSHLVPERVIVFSEVSRQNPQQFKYSVRGDPLIYDDPEVDITFYRSSKRPGSETISLVPLSGEELPGHWQN